MPEEQKKSGLVMWVGGALVLVVLGYGIFNYTKKDSLGTTTNNENTVDNPDIAMVKRDYKDGTYTAEGSYVSPGGEEKISVTLVLKDDVIVDTTVVSFATLPASKNWQGQFISGVKGQVIGKKLSEVTLTKVSGSSLTPKGWNDAIAKIQLQAKA